MKKVVHILLAGRALCKEGLPVHWEANEFWVRLDEKKKATCLKCLEIEPIVKKRNESAI